MSTSTDASTRTRSTRAAPDRSARPVLRTPPGPAAHSGRDDRGETAAAHRRPVDGYRSRVHAVEVVRIGPDDWLELRTVRLASLRDAPDAFGSRYADWVDASEERWRARLTDVAFTVVARLDGQPVGVTSGSRADDSVELISMWVAPGQRGSGLGGRLIEEVVAWARALGLPTCLTVRGDNGAAMRAYARAGFVDHGVPEDRPSGAPPERRLCHGGGGRVSPP